MSIRPLAVALAIPLLLSAAGGRALAQQSSSEIADLRKQIEDLKATQLAIQKDVQEIKAILLRVTQPQAPPSPVTDTSVEIPVAGLPVKGGAQASVAVVEFSDYQCPFCARYVAQTLPQLTADFVATGRIRYYFVNFPIESLHPLAFRAHEAAICAGAQGKYWEMHDRLFANQQALTPPDLEKTAAAIGLDMATFEPCFDSPATAQEVRKGQALGHKVDVTGTPTFVVGVFDPETNAVKGVKVISGAQPYALFKQTIDQVLAERK